MKGVMCQVPPYVLQWRKRTGEEQWDEMWEGILHMPASPTVRQQELEMCLGIWLRTEWAKPHGNKGHNQINVASVGGWPNDYRIPDIVMLTSDCFHIDCNEYFEGAPTVVVEIHSPGDEAYEKLPFCARIGVPEVWVIDRDTKTPTIYVLRGSDYEEVVAAADGWLHSAATGIRLRAPGGKKLAMQLGDDQSTLRLLPED